MRIQNLIIAVIMLFFISCGGEKKEKPAKTPVKKEVTKTPEKVKPKAAEKTGIVDLKNKGIGPIKSIKLDDTIDQAMVTKGADVFKRMCTACHRVNKKFVGPSPQNILERRSPEWVMNMILNPEEMVKKDPIAKQLLLDFNGSPMANQNLTEEEARAVLEYFRTLK